MAETFFTNNDRVDSASMGVREADLKDQLDRISRGPRPLALNRPCTKGDGIKAVDEITAAGFAALCDEAAAEGRFTKFVPASGAATRMFQNWFRLRDLQDAVERRKFLNVLPRYPFYSALIEIMKKNGLSTTDLGFDSAIEYLLTERGLNLGASPKALVPFHRYSDEDIRTALEEQLAEAAMHIADEAGTCRVHFTFSPEHLKDAEHHINLVRGFHEEKRGVTFDVSVTPQHPSTNTLAATLYGEPFRNDKGRLLFRPGGHGALLKNLNELESDIVFIKNIDNVVPDRLKPDVVYYKKVLGGCLLHLQRKAFDYLRRLEALAIPDDETIDEVESFCRESFCLHPPASYRHLGAAEKAEFLFRSLNRPIRVCGMVKNEGEPGGGPFWVNEDDGSVTLQIVEKNQVNSTSEEQRSIWNSSTHFNPVDIACGLKDFRGKSFDLYRFRDGEAFMVAEKTYRGQPLKALELPGLWNGSMARWNTVFIEVPLVTFAPVKTVEDLLRPEHRP
ncbi:MAG: hypothetical protein AVO39_02125 [delta proteobacterium MLS_D]|jgi:hypothetical protein|nr:MAG: hypothetical protein AVO39_02125 [delta proteobacterium MLS_D]